MSIKGEKYIFSNKSSDTGEEGGDNGKIEKEINYKDNIERYREEIPEYLKEGFLETLPEDYKEEYKKIFDEHLEELNKNPINPECKLSLVLPAYKEEKFILSALKSLENQKNISPNDFEVIVVDNYEKGKEPLINDYDQKGKKIGEHKDRTYEIVKQFSQESKIKVLVVKQEFPKEIKGVGIATKLGMDLALKRQENNPQIISYYGSDTIFDENWVKETIDSFQNKDVDGVRGSVRGVYLGNQVEDENGLHTLDKEEINKILNLERERHLYNGKLNQLKHKLNKGENKNSSKKEIYGLSTLTAGMYAKIKGMKPLSSGEDFRLAQDVSDNKGRIFFNERAKTQAIARIEKPRVEKGGSYTNDLWKIYKALKYKEGDILDKDGHLMVEDPDKILEIDRLKKELNVSELSQEQIKQIKEDLDRRFPKITIEEAEKKLGSLTKKLNIKID